MDRAAPRPRRGVTRETETQRYAHEQSDHEGILSRNGPSDSTVVLRPRLPYQIVEERKVNSRALRATIAGPPTRSSQVPLMRQISLAVLMLVAAPAFAQSDRYELGRRLHEFEIAWDKHADDAAAKKRTAPLVKQGFELYFQFDFPGMAQKVDAARHALESIDPAPAPVRWADALQVVPEKRVVDASTDDLTVVVSALYKSDVEHPRGVTVRAKVGNGKAVEAELEKLPATIKVPIKDAPGQTSADFKLTAEVMSDGKVLATRAVGVARVEKMAERVSAIKKAAKEVPSPPTTIEEATFVYSRRSRTT